MPKNAGARTLFPCIEEFSKDSGIPAENLAEAFEIESEFHEKIIHEKNFGKRKKLYESMYGKVHPLYASAKRTSGKKTLTARLFKKWLENKSILDIGCGNGEFLLAVSKSLKHKKLAGIDTFDDLFPKEKSKLSFIKKNIIDFELNEKFDVVFSDNVIEHIARQDLAKHLNSITKALEKDGMLVIVSPNRLFGPSDITRIIDYSYSNKTNALGSHLNELTYNELIPILRKSGFKNFSMPLGLKPCVFEFIEKNSFLIQALHGIKRNGKPLFRLPIMLAAKLGQ